jgi:ubiquinone/menaquinone biosynthesis C-methylase UbiE
MTESDKDEIRQHVRRTYAAVALTPAGGCGCAPSCCSPQVAAVPGASGKVGYAPEELRAVPEGADMGLGCGNPQQIALLKEGEVLLDLGCGGGFDCFLAAEKVGPSGRVIGVDMTPEMIDKARRNARAGGYTNVEFRLGEIEHLPVADSSVDVVLSNCVINLSSDKQQVYREAWRVLKPGGRLAISDIVAVADLPEALKNDLEKHAGCIAGAATAEETVRMLREAGFIDYSVEIQERSRDFIRDWFPKTGVENLVRSAAIRGRK